MRSNAVPCGWGLPEAVGEAAVPAPVRKRLDRDLVARVAERFKGNEGTVDVIDERKTSWFFESTPR